jgi:hypothetical protein
VVAVHGFAMLMRDGRLKRLIASMRDEINEIAPCPQSSTPDEHVA